MGQTETSVDSMLRSNGIAMFLVEPEMVKKKKGYTNSGTLTASNVLLESHPTFSDVSPFIHNCISMHASQNYLKSIKC